MQFNIKTLVLAFGFGTLLLTGCSGGGGSSSPTVTYTGLTTPAVVTAANAPALTTAAVESSENKSLETSTLVIGSSASGDNQGRGLSLPGVATLLAGMKDMIKKPAPATAVGASNTQTIPGTCSTNPGSATVSATDNGSTDTYINVSGSITYNNFCTPVYEEGDVVVNGTVSFSMVGTFTSGTLTMSTSYLTISAGGETVAYSLNFTASYTDTGMTVVMSSDFQGADGKVYRVENYRVDINFDTVTISGKLYHPDHGYVTVSTHPNLGYEYCSTIPAYLPTSGVLRVTGDNGVYAEFRPISCVDGYQVCHTSGTVCETRTWQ